MPWAAAIGQRQSTGHLMITIGRHTNSLIVDKLNDRLPHVPTPKELRDQGRYSWTRIPSHDPLPSARLRVSFDRGWKVRQDSFSDTKTINLEDRLPDVLQELELRAAAAEELDQRRDREREERERLWRQVHDEAVVQAREHHRAEVLATQVARWQETLQLDGFIRAMESNLAVLEPEDRAAAEEWLAWVGEHRRRVDPLAQPLRPPPDPEFTPDRLAPFMRGLSPFGPA